MRLSTYLLLIPALAVAAALAVANREIVHVSLDPFSDTHPAFVLEMPLFLLIFLTLFVGVLLGAGVALLGRRKRKKPQVDEEPREPKLLARSEPGETRGHAA